MPDQSLARNLFEEMAIKRDRLQRENIKLRAALKPFALEPGAVSLSAALGHITREDLIRASSALKNGMEA